MKWIFPNDPNSYYEKKSYNTWFEFKNFKFIAQYEEVELTNKNILTVILKGDDENFVKLTNRALFMGNEKSNVNFFKNYGSWSSQRDKCDGK